MIYYHIILYIFSIDYSFIYLFHLNVIIIFFRIFWWHLLGAPTQTMERSILNYLKKKAPGLENSLETIYTDFKQAAVLAFHYEFPGVKIQGCWFHYSQVNLKINKFIPSLYCLYCVVKFFFFL